MSFFLLYFETKNNKSTNYAGFSEVGAFKMPDEIFAGNIQVVFDKKIYNAAVICDETRQCANNFFSNKYFSLRLKLFNFIEHRLSNNSIISNLAGFIDSNDDFDINIKNIKYIEYKFLANSFHRDNFQFAGLGIISPCPVQPYTKRNE
jgi:hypothetical protein